VNVVPEPKDEENKSLIGLCINSTLSAGCAEIVSRIIKNKESFLTWSVTLTCLRGLAAAWLVLAARLASHINLMNCPW
jgi:hypothetical protein